MLEMLCKMDLKKKYKHKNISSNRLKYLGVFLFAIASIALYRHNLPAVKTPVNITMNKAVANVDISQNALLLQNIDTNPVDAASVDIIKNEELFKEIPQEIKPQDNISNKILMKNKKPIKSNTRKNKKKLNKAAKKSKPQKNISDKTLVKNTEEHAVKDTVVNTNLATNSNVDSGVSSTSNIDSSASSTSSDPTKATDENIVVANPETETTTPSNVTIDDETGNTGNDKEVENIESEEVGNFETPNNTAISSDAGSINIVDDNFIITAVAIDDIKLDDVVEIYQHEGGVLVPLAAVAEIINFPIEVDGSNAEGWFLSENNLFFLDLNRGEVIIKGEKHTFDKGLAVPYFDDIYIDSSLFRKWFDISISMDFLNLLLELHPKEPLPIQQKLERENKYKNLGVKEEIDLGYETIIFDSDIISRPFFDVNIGHTESKSKEGRSSDTSYSVLAQNDLANMSARTFMSGGTDDNLSSFRFNLSKKDIYKNIGGFMHASEIAFGDINSEAVPLVSSGGNGLGFSVSNFDLERKNSFGTRTFRGNYHPNWTLELYHNGALVDYQIVGADGRYLFENKQIYYGSNIFKIIAYGPQGQVEEKIYSDMLDDSILHSKEFKYAISMDKKFKTLMGIDEEDQTFTYKQNERFILDTEYGITDKVTASFDLAKIPLDDGITHKYIGAGIRASFEGFLTDLNFVNDLTNYGKAISASIHTKIGRSSVRLQHTAFDNFVSEIYGNDSENYESISYAMMNGTSLGINYNLSAERKTRESGKNTDIFKGNLSTSINGIAFGNDLDIKKTDGEEKYITGDFSFRGRLHKTLLRSNLSYTVEPDLGADQFSFTAQRNFQDDLNAMLGFTKNLDDKKTTSVSASLNKIFDDFILGTSLHANDDGMRTIGLNVSFGIGVVDNVDGSKRIVTSHNELAARSSISSLVYIDSNNNNKFDADEEQLPDVEVNTNGQTFKVDGEKSVLISGIDPYIPTNVTLNIETISDPLLKPAATGYSIIAPPGTVHQLNFPIVSMSEIEGFLYKRKSNGKASQVKYADISLYDKNGNMIATTNTDLDGFYVFENVVSGEYTIALNNDFKEKYNILSNSKLNIAITDSDIYVGNDLILE